MPLTTYVAGNTITASAQNANMALCVLTDTARTITVSHTWTASQAITSASTTAFAVGLTGATNSAFVVDASTASQVAGLKVTGAATGGTVALQVIDSGATANLSINAKSTGYIALATTGLGVATPVFFNGAEAAVAYLTGQTIANVAFKVIRAAGPAGLSLNRVDGTLAAPTAVQSGESLGDFTFCGLASGTTLTIGAEIQAVTTEIWTGSANGTKLVFYTSPTGSGGAAIAITFEADKTLTYTAKLSSVTALATPSALAATGSYQFASSVSGAALMGFGSANDVALMNRAGTVVLGIGPNTTTVNMVGLVVLNDTTDSTTTTTGAIKTAGGMGIAKALNVGTTATVGTILQVGTTVNIGGSTNSFPRISNSGALAQFEQAAGGDWAGVALAYGVFKNVAVTGTGTCIGGTVQTTIGANGAADALTANPLGYIIAYVGSTKVVIPYYNA